MWPYILCFSLSCYFTKVASKYKNKNKKMEYIVFSVLAVLFPCILAGVRDATVGTDMGVYGNITFYRSLQMDFQDYIISRGGEYLYLIVVYLCSHSLGTLQFQYFVLQAITIIPIYCTLQREKENRFTWFGMLVYYLMLFPYSLNLMRQCIAIAFLFWGFKYVQERNLRKYILVALIATLFHTTAAVGLVVYPVYVLMCTISEDLFKLSWYNRHSNSLVVKIANKYGKVLSWAIILMTIILLTQFSKLVTLLYQFSAEDYSHFYNQLQSYSKLPIIREYIILSIPFFIIYFLNRKYYDHVENDIRALFTLSAMGIILYQAAKISAETYRVSLYFHIFLPLFVMKLLYYKKNAKERLIWMSIMFVCLILFWNTFFIGEKWCQIYPYTSEILGIG